MLWILFIIFCGMFIIAYKHSDFDIECIDSFGVIGLIFSIVLIITIPIPLACYNYTKSTVDSEIKVLNERNDEIVCQIEPYVERYLNYEKSSYEKLKIDSNNIISLKCYPELKGDEFLMKQIDVILNNQNKITDLKLNKARLKSYKLWLFMD